MLASGRTMAAWQRDRETSQHGSKARDLVERTSRAHVVSAELEQALAEPRLHLLADDLAPRLTSCETQQIYPLIIYKRLSWLGASADESTQRARQLVTFEHRGDDLGRCDGAEGGCWGGLPDGGVAVDQGEGKVPAVDCW